MSIDNLLVELPRDASEGFGKRLIERVNSALIGHDKRQCDLSIYHSSQR